MTKYSKIFIQIFPLYIRKKKYFKIFSMCLYKMNNKYDYKNTYINIGNHNYPVKFYFKRGIKLFKNYYFNLYKAEFNYDTFIDLPIQNDVLMNFMVNDEVVSYKIVYNAIYYRFCIGNHSSIYNYHNQDLCVYFRQTKRNSLGLTVRNKNLTDKHSFKIFIAWFLSLFSFRSKIVLLYEKNNMKYEESSSSVYEKLFDLGYPVYFILNEKSKHWVNIKEKYRKNIIKSFTFKHYYMYFKCKRFIASESLPHATELRTINRFLNFKLFRKKYKYVFLQHGVMYMVSLDSNNRSFFRKGNEMPNGSKIVVSSKLEAMHFVDLGGFDMEDLYIVGLPAFDKSKRDDDASKILIMLTWRPWDYNTLESNYHESSYYKMLIKILENIPSDLKDKVRILPHPLVKSKLELTDLKKYIPDVVSYDKFLEETNLLITDYSSISYSSFYRGSNVIFCWQELEECMKHYNGHLMLNDNNVFGDVCYDYKSLSKAIKNNYKKAQKKKYIERYSKIVEFHDNKNTLRLIAKLKEDKFFE